MKLSSYVLVLRLTHEGIINFSSTSDFDKKFIENFPSARKNSVPAVEPDTSNSIAAEDSVTVASISSISESRLITAANTKN